MKRKLKRCSGLKPTTHALLYTQFRWRIFYQIPCYMRVWAWRGAFLVVLLLILVLVIVLLSILSINLEGSLGLTWGGIK